MSSEQIDIVFKRYLSGQANPNDLKQLAEYMQQGDAAGLKQQIRTELEKAIARKEAAIIPMPVLLPTLFTRFIIVYSFLSRSFIQPAGLYPSIL